MIEFTIDGWEGLEVHLKLIDPPDTAAYAPDDGWDMGRPKKMPYEANDNVEDLTTADIGISLDPTGPWAKKLNVTPGSGGTATVYLKVTDRYAGDNYQVEVMKCVPSGCGTAPGFTGVLTERVVALSPIFTAWKRIYIERDRMFRKGGVLAEDYLTLIGTCGGGYPYLCCGQAGALPCDQVKVHGWSEVDPGDWVVFFDHLDSLSANPVNLDKRLPVRLVLAVSDPNPEGFRIVTFDQPLKRNLLSSSVTNTEFLGYGYMPDFINHQSAGFGVVSASCDLASAQLNGSDSCFFEADLRGIEKPYADAFVEVFAPRTGMSFLPYLSDEWYEWQLLFGESGGLRPLDHFSKTWFLHHNENPSNYRHVIGASSNVSLGYRGMTSPSDYHWVCVFRGTIEDSDVEHTPEEVDHSTQLTTVHELGHQFDVLECNPDVGGGEHHTDSPDFVEAWCEKDSLCPPYAHSQELCIMNDGLYLTEEDQRRDSFFQFDVECLFSGNPDCADPPDPQPEHPNSSIRGAEDPLP